MSRWGIFILSLWSIAGCQQESSSREYLFLSHLYQWGVADNNRIDYRFEGFDFSVYDQLWLGGDLCARTSESPQTIAYLDSIFDLSAPTVHWAWGNHDLIKGNPDWIEARTKKPSFYQTTIDDLCLVVLNTNEFRSPNYQSKPKECAILEGQLNLLRSLSDTLTTASHLVVLHHYSVLTSGLMGDSIDMGRVTNFYHPELYVDCKAPGTFEDLMYPLLQQIQARGIQVVMVSGDYGQRCKAFAYQDKAGIWFLGSGINNSALSVKLPEYVTSTDPDQLLLFRHDRDQRSLTWEFIDLDSLIQARGE